jgi:two-component system nitrogen regulation sensor histidine kinase GlnL
LSDLHQQALDSINTGILVFDGDGRLVYLNPYAEEILQGSAQHLKGRHYRTLFRGSPSAARIARKALDENAAVTGFDVELRLPKRKPDMAPLSVIIGASPLSGPEGELRGAVLSMKPSDILTMVEQEEQAALSAAEMQMLAYGIAHEIKNPLGGILGAAQWILRNEASEAERGEGIRLIRREAERINGLVEKMLEMGKSAGVPRAFPLPPLLFEAEELIRSEVRAQGKEIVFERQVDPSLPDVHGQPDPIFRAIVNVLKNAVEAIRKKGTIRIDARLNVNFRVSRGRGRKRSFLEIVIADSGEGMTEEDVRKAFLPFYTTKPKGTGLGLVMARQAITRNGGKLEIKSVRGSGTTVKISLPVEPGKKASR